MQNVEWEARFFKSGDLNVKKTLERNEMKWQSKCIQLAIFALIFAIAGSCSLKNTRYKSEDSFVAWWQEPHDEMFYQYGFMDLKKAERLDILKPEFVDIQVGDTLKLYDSADDPERNPQGNWQVLLVNPRQEIIEPDKYSTDEYFKRLDKCAEKHSWIVVRETEKWTETKFNPYCSMVYTTDDIDISLYWCADSEMPLIEFITNHPACVPRYLYRWSKDEKAYQFVGEKCD